MADHIRIGELAKRSNCSIDTVRYYEKQGLLAEAQRSGGNFRLYGDGDLERLQFIRTCRSLDMNLAEIRTLLHTRDHPNDECGEVIALLDEHLKHVGSRISELRSLERHLIHLRGCCDEGRTGRDCGILKELAHDAQSSR